MRKIFILGGSSLQLDLILEAKKMFFYTIVLDYDENCIGAKWCDEFLHIDIADQELVLEKAKEYKIDVILTSATELGNITSCYVGEKLGLNTNSYQTALNTTNKVLMKDIMVKNNILTAKYKVYNINESIDWDIFPCILKISNGSSGKGLSYCKNKNAFKKAIEKAKIFTKEQIIVEEYIYGVQYSCETISCNKKHQIITIDYEEITFPPNIIEKSHTIPADIGKEQIEVLIFDILNIFNIKYGAAHIEFRITPNNQIYIIELASRTGGMRSEMINFAYGINYSQLLILSALNIERRIEYKYYKKIKCNFIIDYNSYLKYLEYKIDSKVCLFEPFTIENIDKNFIASHLGESKGYYFIMENKN
jgi:carbamoyl-phosphate synthase large subunit